MALADYKDKIDAAVGYEAVKNMMVKLVQTPSPQTDLMEAEPQILAFIKKCRGTRTARHGCGQHRL